MNRACLECQKRKTKCREAADGSGSCSYCIKTRKQCVFEAPAPRTPLTRRNLDAVEWKCQRLESLIRSIDPNLDIEAALKGQRPSSSSNGQLSGPRAESRSVSPTPADDYEWHESVSQAEVRSPSGDGTFVWDGMASLSTRASGYLGKLPSRARPCNSQTFLLTWSRQQFRIESSAVNFSIASGRRSG
jgi:transcriptional regulatory protein GAL4